MATRSAKLYQGEDMAPVLDYTDLLIWEESEFGTRAWRGEGSSSTVVIRDPYGEQGNASGLPAGLTMKSLASKNLFVIDLDDDIMFRGRVGIKNYSRDGQQTERYRQVECQLHDTHWDLDHIFVHNYARPSETDNARIQGVMASYLSASPRPTTDLNGSNFLSGSNTVTLPAETFQRTTPLQIIRDTALSGNKQFFITGDTLGGGSMFYDGNDSTVYQAGLRISDRPSEINTEGSCVATTATVEHADFVIGGTSPQSIVVPADLENSILIVFGAWRSDDAPDSATYGATSLTAIPGSTVTAPGGGVVASMKAFYMLDPPADPTGIGSLLQVLSAASNGCWKGYMVLSGVDQSDPIASVTTNSGTSTTPNVAVSGSADLALLNGFFAWNNDVNPTADPTPAAGQTEGWSIAQDNPNPGLGDLEFAGGYGDSTPSWTRHSSSSPWAAVGLAVNGASPGAGSLTFPPIWNVGPASTEDGSEQLCEVVLFYGSGGDQYVTAHNLTVHTQYGHWSETFTDDSIPDATEAQRRANSILAHRQYEDKTYNATIGPLTDEQVLCVKHGQTIQIKARAIPDADDAFRTMRIVQCRYTTPVVGAWFAHLQLGRPWKLEPYGTGTPLSSTSGAASDTTPEPIGSEGSPGTDNGEVAAADHVHAHGTIADIPGGTAHPAVDVSITDAGGHFTGTDVEAALQELGAAGGGLTDHDHTGAGDGGDLDAPVIDGYAVFNEESAPGTASSGTVRVYAKTDGKLYIKDDAGTETDLTATGGGGGGVASPFWWHSDNAPGSPNAANREFTEGTVVGTLTRVANGTPRGTWAEVRDGLEWTHTVTTGTELDVYAIPLTISVGDYVTIAGFMPGHVPNYMGPFVGFSDGTTYGTSNAVGVTSHPSGVSYNALLNRYPGFNSRTIDGTIYNGTISRGTLAWGYRVKYEAANTWGLYVRENGGQWRTVQTNYSYTLTPTHVIFGVNMLTAAFTAGAGAGVRLETFRVND